MDVTDTFLIKKTLPVGLNPTFWYTLTQMCPEQNAIYIEQVKIRCTLYVCDKEL